MDASSGFFSILTSSLKTYTKMHFVRAAAPMGTIKLKIGVVNKTIKAFLVMPQHWLDAHEILKYYTHVLLRVS